MEKILVTGGAGFIGSNLCEHLVLNGYDVVCLDNFSTGHMSNIQHLIDGYPLNFKLIEGDIRNFIIRKTKNSSFKNEKLKKEVDVTITVSNKDIV